MPALPTLTTLLLSLPAPSLAWDPVSPPAVTLVAAARGPQEVPLVYVGDGLTVTVTAIDGKTGKVSGTMALKGAAPLSFALQMDVSASGVEIGRGSVQDGPKSRRLRTKEISDESVQVTYRAKRYAVTLRANPKGKDRVGKPAGPAEGGAKTQPALSTVTLRQHTFKDKGMGGMESHTILVPKGWKAEGGAFWGPQQWFNVMPSQDIRVVAPNGTLVSIEPSFVARDSTPPPELGMPKPPMGSVDGGFPVIPWPSGLAQWKRWLSEDVIKFAFPKASGIRVTEAMVMPELTKDVRRAYAPFKRMLESNNGLGGMRTTADCQVLGFFSTYTIEGTAFEELRLVSLTSNILEGAYIGQSVMWSVERAITYRAPAGTLEENMGLLKAIADSLRMTDRWFMMRAEMQAKLMKISRQISIDNMNAARKRSEILAQSSRDLNQISMDGYRRREAIKDGVHDRVIHSIQETEVYTVPGSSQQVQLPSSYDSVFTNSQGEFLLTNDALFQPGVDLEYNGSTWTKMSVAGGR